MNYGDFHKDLQNSERDAYQELGYGFEERVIHVVDEEGFIHVVTGISYDKESGAFWIRSRFRNEKENGE